MNLANSWVFLEFFVLGAFFEAFFGFFVHLFTIILNAFINRRCQARVIGNVIRITENEKKKKNLELLGTKKFAYKKKKIWGPYL